MIFSALVISQGTNFGTDIVGKVFQFIQDTPDLLFHSVQNLSPDKAIDFLIQTDPDSKATTDELFTSTKAKLKQLNSVYNESKSNKADKIDIILQVNDNSRKNKKLFIFDMDSTLITQEVIELIAAYADVEDKVRDITESAMRGEIDFTQSLAKRVSLLKGIESSKLWDELQAKLNLTNGAVELTKGLKKLGITLGVLSGGFIPLASYLKNKLGLDYAFANNLKVEIDPTLQKEILSGETFGEVVNGDKKAELLARIAKENDIDVKDAVAVGDGANDLKMMSVAGWGIAWNAKPKVQQEAQSALNSNSLADIFYILGYNDTEIDTLLK